MQKSLKLQQNTGLTTSKIIASKRWGNNVVFLTETCGAFVLSAGEIVSSISGSRLRIIAKRVLTLEEANNALSTIFVAENATQNSEAILLEIPEIKSETFVKSKNVRPFESPYFSKDLSFFVSQLTRAPNLAI